MDSNLYEEILLSFYAQDYKAIKGFKNQDIRITDIQGEMAFSSYYSFEVSFIYPANLPVLAEHLLNQVANISFGEYTGKDLPTLCGIVTSFQQKNYLSSSKKAGHDDYIAYSVTICPHASYLLHSKHTQFFTSLSLKDIIPKITEPYNLQVEFDLVPKGTTLPSLDFVFQFEETDANFIGRMLEKYGMYFYFKQGSGKKSSAEVMVISNSSSQLKASAFVPTLKYQRDAKGLNNNDVFMSLSNRFTPPPSAVIIKSYDYTTASNKINSTVFATDAAQKNANSKNKSDTKSSSKKIAAVKVHAKSTDPAAKVASSAAPAGYVVEKWSSDIVTPKGTEALAKIIMGAYKAAAEVVEIEITPNYLVPGDLVSIKDYPITEVNKNYLVTKINYDINFSHSVLATLGLSGAENNSKESQCTVTLIPHETPYYQPLLTPTPQIPGVIPGVISGDKEGSVNITKSGEYTVQLPVDNNESSEITCPIRKMEPSLYNKSGVFNPLKVGTEVLIAFQNGDPNVPIIVGAVANSVNEAIVSASNSHLTGMQNSPNATQDDDDDAWDDDDDPWDDEDDASDQHEETGKHAASGKHGQTGKQGASGQQDNGNMEGYDHDEVDDSIAEQHDYVNDEIEYALEEQEERDAAATQADNAEYDEKEEAEEKLDEEHHTFDSGDTLSFSKGYVVQASTAATGNVKASQLKTYLAGTLTHKTGDWNPGQYSVQYDGTPGDSATTVHYPNGSVVHMSAKEAMMYHAKDTFSMALGNAYSTNIGDSYSITCGKSTSRVYGDSLSIVGRAGRSMGQPGTSTSIIYQDSITTTYGDSTQTTMGDSTTKTLGNSMSTSNGNVDSITMGTENTLTMGASSSMILGPSNSIMMSQGSMVFVGLNSMVNMGLNMSFDMGWNAHFGEGLTTDLTPVKETVTPLFHEIIAGGSTIVMSAAGVDIVSAGPVVITASAIILNGAVEMLNAGVTTAEVGVANETAGAKTTEAGVISDV